MESDRSRTRQLRLRLVAILALIVAFSVAAIRRSTGNSAGTTVLGIVAALVIVAALLFAFRRPLGKTAETLQNLRRTESVAIACYFESGKRGIISATHGELIIRHFTGTSLAEDLRLDPGTFTIAPAKVHLTARRETDGIVVSAAGAAADSGGMRVALSQDNMTLTGNMLKGPNLELAIENLRNG